jgi:hypothetical protein
VGAELVLQNVLGIPPSGVVFRLHRCKSIVVLRLFVRGHAPDSYGWVVKQFLCRDLIERSGAGRPRSGKLDESSRKESIGATDNCGNEESNAVGSL